LPFWPLDMLAGMRTAVVRVDVDPSAELAPAQLADGMTMLSELAAAAGVEAVDADLAAMPAKRRQVELLITGDDPFALTALAIDLCGKAFGTRPIAGVVTYISRGTDDDAHGVLAGLGLTGEVTRTPSGVDGPGWDTVSVTLRKADLERVPESRVHTALEASLNCEVHIVVE
jgi:hypothetical protein